MYKRVAGANKKGWGRSEQSQQGSKSFKCTSTTEHGHVSLIKSQPNLTRRRLFFLAARTLGALRPSGPLPRQRLGSSTSSRRLLVNRPPGNDDLAEANGIVVGEPPEPPLKLVVDTSSAMRSSGVRRRSRSQLSRSKPAKPRKTRRRSPHRPLTFCSLLAGCRIPCACHTKRRFNVQKWREHVVFLAF